MRKPRFGDISTLFLVHKPVGFMWFPEIERCANSMT